MANQIKAPINYPVIAGGKIVAGGSVLFGQPNVKPDEDNPSTLKAVYLDAALTRPAQNPQGLSSDGVFDQSDTGILFGSDNTVYSIVIKGANKKELSYIPEYDLSDANAAATAQDAAAAAASSEANALSFKNLTEALYTDFTNRYFGAFSSDPSVDDLGNPPNEGSIYFNSTSNVFFTWTDGAWVNHFPSNPNGLLVTATGTTTPRTLGDRFSDAVNVKDFGAVGDGVTDDTAAIQAAVATQNTEVIVTGGNYLISNFTVASGVTIRGEGRSVFKAPSYINTSMPWCQNSVQPASATRGDKNIRITGITWDASDAPVERWLHNTVLDVPVADPELDYYNVATNPSGKIGNPSYPMYDISDVVTEGRRNPDYLIGLTAIAFVKVDSPTVDRCTFINVKGRVVTDSGCLNSVYSKNHFDQCGKDDGAFHCFWVQSSGNPDNPPVGFMDSENVEVSYNTAKDIERSLALFAPTKGGSLHHNYVDGWGESCVFVPHVINKNGGRSYIHHNTMINGKLTDIAGQGIEAGGAIDIDIHHNTIEGSSMQALVLTGVANSRIENNTLKNNYTATTIPYGPFSERWAFNVGQAPIAGNVLDRAVEAVINIGTLGSFVGGNTTINENTIVDDRATPIGYPFKQTKTSSSNSGKSLAIKNNIIDIGGETTLLNTDVGTVWLPSMPLFMGGNIGTHANGTRVVGQILQGGVTGQITIDCGFRPSEVNVCVVSNNPAQGRLSDGVFSWNEEGVRNDFSVSTNLIEPSIRFNDLDVIKIFNNLGVIEFLAEFVQWTETGFILNVVTSAAGNLPTRFACRAY